MQENKQKSLREDLRRDVAVFGNLRALCVAAVLAAMSLVLGKFLQIPNPFQDVIRLSFENLPILFAGITMGPLVGAMVGAVADLIGCLLVGYAINPIITIGAAAIGAVAGIYHFLPEASSSRAHLLKISLTVFSAHLIGSVLIKSFGLSVFYDIPLIILMLWRLLNYIIVGAVECMLIYTLVKNRAISSAIASVKGGKSGK